MGSRGVFVNPDPYCREVWPNESWDEVHGARGNIREIASGTQRTLRVLASITRRSRSGSSVLCLETMHRSIASLLPSISSMSTLQRRPGDLVCTPSTSSSSSITLNSKICGVCGIVQSREVQVLLLEATTARCYCSLKRLAERFPFNPNDDFTVGQRTELVSQIHAGKWRASRRPERSTGLQYGPRPFHGRQPTTP